MNAVVTTRSGNHIVVKSAIRADVEATVSQLVEQGAVLVGAIGQLGNNWIATVQDAEKNVAKEWTTVTNIGLQFVVEGSSREAVAAYVEDMITYGSVLIAGPEEIEGKWVAVIDRRESRRTT